ncbi:MAG: hypothetical protein R2727_01650 [Bacteroidales bacterium]
MSLPSTVKVKWGPATNLGTVINTPYNEDTPFITVNDSVLIFSSEGHTNMGGYDLFRTTVQGGSWKTRGISATHSIQAR